MDMLGCLNTFFITYIFGEHYYIYCDAEDVKDGGKRSIVAVTT